MGKLIEANDEELKASSRSWWSEHSQDYHDSSESMHLGADLTRSDAEYIAYLDELDKSFQRQAYFAQGRGQPLFSGLMPVSELSGKKVLEIGCGLGAHSEMLARAGAELTSIDLSPVSVEATKRRFALKNLKGNIQVADAENLPFTDESFDYVWSWGVIHHSPNTVKCAQEITRVLKPGGQLGIMLYHRNSLYNWVNVIFRFGVLKGKLLKHSIQELHNLYTDGRYIGGAPLSKYYSRRVVKQILFPELKVDHQIAFEQKKAMSFIVPAKYREKFESLIPDSLYTFIFKRLGFLLFTTATKPLKLAK